MDISCRKVSIVERDSIERWVIMRCKEKENVIKYDTKQLFIKL